MVGLRPDLPLPVSSRLGRSFPFPVSLSSQGSQSGAGNQVELDVDPKGGEAKQL